MRTIVNDSTLGIVDNDPLVASAIQSLLVETCAPIQILWTVTSAEQALEAMRDSAQRPQAVLTDIAMPGMNGSELAHHIKEQHPDIAVIGISAFLDDENEKRYGAQWSDAFYAIIPKEIPTIQLVRIIGKATGNDEVASWAGKSINSMRLSGKELQIIANYARGFTTSTIARQLNISEASVKTYARRAFEKLHVHSRAEAVAETRCIKRWDAAPELPGAMQFGKYITAKGVLASVGHTQAEFEDIQTAYEAGYTHATHFYNAMPGFHKRKEYKYEGTVESIYLIDDMTVEVVADGIHVPPTILRLVYKIKGVERTCLITDALACAASDSQVAFDPRVIIEDGVCKLADHSALAGSVATMDRLIRTMVQKAEIPLEDAVRMASETPARIMGVLDRKGTLERGKDADMIALDRDLNVRAVWAMGELVEGTNKLF